MPDSPPKVPINPDESQPWVEMANKARLDAYAILHTPPPTEGSNFARLASLFPVQTPASWCRSYIDAALEHGLMWADHVAPLRFSPDTEIFHTLRPTLTLARASAESASQAVWLMDPTSLEGCADRHASLILHDLSERAKFLEEPEKSETRELAAQLTTEYNVAYGKNSSTFPGYMAVVESAATVVATKGGVLFNGERTVSQLWRASAGAAHGKRWPAEHFRVPAEISPDGPKVVVPDLQLMTQVVRLASDITNYAVLRFMDFSGHSARIPDILRSGLEDLWSRIPRAEGPIPPSAFDELSARN